MAVQNVPVPSADCVKMTQTLNFVAFKKYFMEANKLIFLSGDGKARIPRGTKLLKYKSKKIKIIIRMGFR